MLIVLPGISSREPSMANVPFYALQAFGFEVHAVCPGKKAGDFVYTSIFQGLAYQYATEIEGHKFKLNATFADVKASNYDGLLIPGGRAPEYLAMNTSVPIASICHGSLMLAAADMVKDRTLTAFPSLEAVLIGSGAHWVPPHTLADYYLDENLVSGDLVSGVTYEANAKFISLFLKTLRCKDFTEELELMVPFQALQALGCRVDAVCPNKKAGETCITTIQEYESGAQTYSGRSGYYFSLTRTFEDVDYKSYDALVLPGGQAPEYLSVNKSGKKYTAHPWVKLNVVKAGGIWTEPDAIDGDLVSGPVVEPSLMDLLDHCVTDGKLVTVAAWPGNSNFISQLMKVLEIEVSF
ncbi:hypothetical protein MKW94_002943 [Papaver nudicaule]|uniref:DJ-1/PfpI domain-containing protein n=1 Tax=Papaver nudicaule TaxID=74823 RepID=A0AA41S7G4_PAPNU|nr:hypothetical protein [Papaver nudicaule]